MAGFTSPAAAAQSGVLNSPPGMPPGGQRKSLMDLAGAAPDGGMGEQATSPQVMALQALKMMETGAQLMASALPAVAGPVIAFLDQLKQVVPQQLASDAAGGSPSAAGAPPAPPGPPAAPGGGPIPGGGMQ
jgi:hypothetical protein